MMETGRGVDLQLWVCRGSPKSGLDTDAVNCEAHAYFLGQLVFRVPLLSLQIRLEPCQTFSLLRKALTTKQKSSSHLENEDASRSKESESWVWNERLVLQQQGNTLLELGFGSRYMAPQALD